MTTMADVRAAQPKWFSRKNKRFFGDIWYKMRRGRKSHNPFLVRATYMWSDMFGQPRKVCYRVSRIEPKTLKINGLVDKIFYDMDDVREWLREA